MKTTSVITKQTKNGADYHVFTLENGKKLSVFKFDTRFSEIQVGTDIPDSVLLYDDAYDNYKLKPLPRATTYVKGPGGYKGVEIEKAQETKREDIKVAQERKHEAISIAGAFRDATLISLASMKDQPFPTDAEFKEEWTKWVKWILSKHDEPFL